MSECLVWLVLNDGAWEYVSSADSAEEAAVIDRVLIPITLGERGWVGGRHSGYTVSGEIGGKSALLRLWDEESPLADIGVCLHSRSAPSLWNALHEAPVDDLADINIPLNVPWCAVRCYALEAALPSWFDNWTKTLGVALMRREGW